jgi:triacylglycerol lipase
MSPTSRVRRPAGASPLSAMSGAAALAARSWQPVIELGLLVHDPIFWGWGVPRGDGHRVLALPGLFAGDRYLQPLRGWLRRIGYEPVRSGIDRNPGWSQELVQELEELAERASDAGSRRITIIGHSMGGILGRSVARRRPHAVRHLITLGSPLLMARGPFPETVRFTALYSRSDPIVRHPGAMSRDSGARNIEVPGSHTGLAGNPQVYRILADLLPDPLVRAPR